MDEKTRQIFNDFPMDRAVTMDNLCSMGHSIADITVALMTLEMNGLISTLPGNLFIRR